MSYVFDIGTEAVWAGGYDFNKLYREFGLGLGALLLDDLSRFVAFAFDRYMKSHNIENGIQIDLRNLEVALEESKMKGTEIVYASMV